MALQYPQEPFYVYSQPHWPENVKPALTEDDSSSILDDKVLDHPTPADMNPSDPGDSRRPSMPKLEQDFPAATNLWQERPSSVMTLHRHYSQPSMPLNSPHPHPFSQVNQVNCPPPMFTQPWPLFARSEASTPTPFFGSVQDSFDSQPHYPGGPVNISTFTQPEPLSSISMSPQSSQGGWASATSSDVAEAARGARHSRLRGATPTLVLRSDGIRKKNAKFDIPRDRNLLNIDTLINSTTNEEEKKELKQQKRLLRNRQAALDSRQRKKNHTERLEMDKIEWDQEKRDLLAQQEAEREQWAHQQEQWMHRVAQLEQIIRTVEYERDEAIRTKVIETSELRRMNNLLKDTVKDFTRQNQQASRPFATDSSDSFASDFSAFNVDDSWDAFSLNEVDRDLKMEDPNPNPLHRHTTPQPPISTNSESTVDASDKGSDVKVETGTFSWNTFNMCLLAGAFLVAQAGTKTSGSSSSTALVNPDLPTLSQDYHAEARNVLNAVFGPGSDVVDQSLPSRPAPPVEAGFNHGPSTLQTAGSASSLETLHSTLTTPSRQQQVAAAFSLSANSYNHIANPDTIFDDDDDDENDAGEVKPTRLQQLFARIQADTDHLDKMSGMGSKARERSVLLDRVPEKVLRDFKEMIARTN
ncbi:hypothetical protein PV10_08028 [Exophiala mesophila]|uniref:BZIP domain-containing protein n=1 Tax=Exophiala mesophila TaxID=212818 RepID=A0A0D1XJG5_EXOME|nr:uncharacterized protein PV10_08028 [Exophiala mesophila]KIV88336.1 hypothetical protein PV10_08028 [Exophiala mesophila]